MWVGSNTVGSALPEGVQVAGVHARTFRVVVNEAADTCQRYSTSPLELFNAWIELSVTRLPPELNTTVFVSLTDELAPLWALWMVVVPEYVTVFVPLVEEYRKISPAVGCVFPVEPPIESPFTDPLPMP